MKTRLKKYRKWIWILFFPGLVMADIYQKNDANAGVIEFSDMPAENAALVTLKSINLYTSHMVDNEQADARSKNMTHMPENFYKKIEIIQPIDQETFQNPKEITAKVSMAPSLKSGDKIAWILDEKLYQRSSELEAHFHLLDRGQHQLEAAIINEHDKSRLSSNIVIFYVHRPTIKSEK